MMHSESAKSGHRNMQCRNPFWNQISGLHCSDAHLLVFIEHVQTVVGIMVVSSSSVLYNCTRILFLPTISENIILNYGIPIYHNFCGFHNKPIMTIHDVVLASGERQISLPEAVVQDKLHYKIQMRS